jgi:hypothetical protein
MTNDIELVAAALANARGMRRGAPPISNILEVLREMQVGGKASIYDDLMDDAHEVVTALQQAGRFA